MLDSVHLEQLGVPTVTFVTAPFEGAARTHARIHAMPELPLLVVPSDYLENSPEVLATRLAPVVDEVLGRLFGITAPGGPTDD